MKGERPETLQNVTMTRLGTVEMTLTNRKKTLRRNVV